MIAIDIVLIPSQEIVERAISVNKKLITQTRDSNIQLNKETCIPHISLAMGCVEDSSLPQIQDILREAAKKFLPLQLAITKIDTHQASTGEVICEFSVAKTDQLIELHRTLTEKTNQFIIEPSIEGFFSQKSVDQKSVQWMANHRRNSQKGVFFPHITAGIGEHVWQELNLSCTVKALSVCHFGNYCTCKKILFSTNENL